MQDVPLNPPVGIDQSPANTCRHKLAVLVVFGAYILLSAACTQDPIELGHAVYQNDSVKGSCESGERPGNAGIINDQSTVGGIKYNVRTPANYKPTIAHPLLVVYAPAKRSRTGTERFTGLTLEATAAGFVIVYADHRRLSKSTIVELGSIPALVAEKWCIDTTKVYPTGHSDGGTVAMGLAFLDETKNIPAALAPSAAGITRGDLAEYSCPEPISIMIMHSADDSLFPGYGAQAAAWWAACNRCSSTSGEATANGCRNYSNCAENVTTWYCEGSGSHARWPRINSSMIGFFSALDRTSATNIDNDK